MCTPKVPTETRAIPNIGQHLRDPTGPEGPEHNFGAGKDGSAPSARLFLGATGVCMAGLGAAAAIVAQTAPKGCGTVFQLTPQVDGRWNEAILRSFVSDDGGPWSPLIQDASGNLYGTTEGRPISDSEVFELTRPRTAGSLAYSTAMSLGPASHRQHWKSPRRHRPRPAQ